MGDWKRASNRHKAAVFDFIGVPHDIKVRVPRQVKDNPDNESHVIREVAELLAVHPRVFLALRMNSGAASYEAASGKWAPVWFHKWVKPAKGLRLSDYIGVSTDNRLIALECKHRQWKKCTDQREDEQAMFLTAVLESGGIAGFVRGIDEAKALLDQ